MRPVERSQYLFSEIRFFLSALLNQAHTITTNPSHCSISGNKKADSLAKMGAIEGDILTENSYDFFHCSSEYLDQLAAKWNDGDFHDNR